jgi:hypothetical protein
MYIYCIYRIMAVMKVNTDTTLSIKASPIGNSNMFDVTMTIIFSQFVVS